MTDTMTWNGPVKAEPDFNNLLAVVQGETPNRPTLFEFFLNEPLYRKLAGASFVNSVAGDRRARLMVQTMAFRNAGYDYATIGIPNFGFPRNQQSKEATISQNEGFVITDRASFDAYAWPDPDTVDYGVLDDVGSMLPQGMKFIVHGPSGVLENVTFLLGFERLCYMMIDDEALVSDVFEAVGSRLLRYYQKVANHPLVGAIIGNDDWGFKSQPMLMPEQMRRYVLPWHKQIVATAHAAGKPAILHSCGNLSLLMDDIIDDLKYDAKHSFEDTIQPIEEAYKQYGDRVALVGGIDLDFLCRSTPEAIRSRAENMLAMTAPHGHYALGSGNSIPEYVPWNNYFAMIRAATDLR